MGKSKIEWCEHTWNPVVGCSPTSEGCENCYAETTAKRFAGKLGYPKIQYFKPRIKTTKKALEEPLSKKKSIIYFVCSMGDLFHEKVKDEWLYKVFDVIYRCPAHYFLILTKRPLRMASFFRELEMRSGKEFKDLFPNVGIGVTGENQERLDERCDVLSDIKANMRFLSVEPQLEYVSIHHHKWLDWVICGCESGPNRRPFNNDWATRLANECISYKISFFFKQGRTTKDQVSKMMFINGIVGMPDTSHMVFDQSPPMPTDTRYYKKKDIVREAVKREIDRLTHPAPENYRFAEDLLKDFDWYWLVGEMKSVEYIPAYIDTRNRATLLTYITGIINTREQKADGIVRRSLYSVTNRDLTIAF